MRIQIDGAEQLLTSADSITPEAACTSAQLHLRVGPDAFGGYWNAAQAVAGVQYGLVRALAEAREPVSSQMP